MARDTCLVGEGLVTYLLDRLPSKGAFAPEFSTPRFGGGFVFSAVS